ncbi:alcohol dehydogenase [Pilatotrama ljubarskyi]|nr:alcohol dehydogenase [Pilatotrama ljubarskyi]
MFAYRFVPGLKVPQREMIPIPTPGPDEVLVKVLAAGVCHSDVHLLEWSDTHPFVPYTHTLGHEGAGIVVRLGDNVAADPTPSPRLVVGTYVAVLLTNACEEPGCSRCSRGLANVCFARPMIGIGADGCWAQYVVAAARTVVPVPGNDPNHPRLAPAAVAVATDAVMTPWHGLKRVAAMQRGDNVVVLGCGGLGGNAIQIAKLLGANVVVASDIREDARALARRAGADYAVSPDELKALLAEKALEVDVVVDIVGRQSTVDSAIQLVRTGGTVLLLGIGDDTVAISPLVFTKRQLAIKGSFGGDYQDLQECLEAVAEGKIVPEVDERPMEQCERVVHELATGKIRARVVMIP